MVYNPPTAPQHFPKILVKLQPFGFGRSDFGLRLVLRGWGGVVFGGCGLCLGMLFCFCVKQQQQHLTYILTTAPGPEDLSRALGHESVKVIQGSH